jgi:hypothetical protein
MTPRLIEELEDLAGRLRGFFAMAEYPNTHRVAIDLIEDAVQLLKGNDIERSLFKQAISWSFHSETKDAIRDELGYNGDMKIVNEIVSLLNSINADYDTVYEWSKK